MVLYLVILVPLSVYYFNKISIISLLKKKKKNEEEEDVDAEDFSINDVYLSF